MLITLLNRFSIVLVSASLLAPSVSVAADIQPEKRQRVEQREKMRGDMRQAWANMTPDEREALRREQSDFEDHGAGRVRAVGDEARPARQVSAAHRPLSAEEHHHLRRQLRDLSQEDRR